MKNLVRSYFEFFSNKDIYNLKNMFADEVILQDWDILAIGKEKVIEANQNIFNSVSTISVTLKSMYQDGLVTICLIEILINKEEILKVVDIIKFNNENKIIAISAYKQ